jgi:plasmid rolling circle replication initiator protein Rep
MPITATEPVYLTALSPKDKNWDERRAEADGFRDLYKGTDFDCYASRITNCSELLVFAFQVAETGVCALKLQAARFCRVRHCPVCQWRRSLMWRAKAFKVLPQVIEKYPKSSFLFLTLTVKNCRLEELRETLTWMNKAWKKLTERATWPAQGWIKAVEVTRDHQDWAHPHFHCLLMVPPGYFRGGVYLSQERWSQLWGDCLKVNYTPVVHIQAVKAPKGTSEGQAGAAMLTALCETLKYSVKPSDVLRDDGKGMADQEWLVELTKQLHKTRAVATGGILKEFMSVEEDPDSLIHADDDSINEADTDSPRVAFGWREKAKRYRLTEDC